MFYVAVGQGTSSDVGQSVKSLAGFHSQHLSQDDGSQQFAEVPSRDQQTLLWTWHASANACGRGRNFWWLRTRMQTFPQKNISNNNTTEFQLHLQFLPMPHY